MGPEGITTRQKPGAFETTWERAEIRPETTALVVVGTAFRSATPGKDMFQHLADCGVDCGYLTGRVDKMVVPNITSLIQAFLAAGAAVAVVHVGEMTDSLPGAARSGQERQLAGADQHDVVMALDAVNGNLTLTKLGSGGFTSPDLDWHFRLAGVSTVFYAGVMTDGCLLQTTAAGSRLGYDGYMVVDATATLSEELQAAAEATAIPIATCTSAEEAISLLTRGEPRP